MLKRSLSAIVAALALAAFVAPALSADLPVTKAPSIFTGYPYNGSGFYYGVNTLADAMSGSVSGQPGTTGTMFAVGAGAGATVGYQWGRGTTFYAVEAMANYKNVGADNPGVGAVNSRWGFEARAKFGGPLAAVLAVLPNGIAASPGLPVLNVAVNTAAHPYLMAGVRVDDESASLLGVGGGKAWRARASVGAGIMHQLANGIVADSWVEYNPASTGFVIGGAGATGNLGPGVRIGAALLY